MNMDMLFIPDSYQDHVYSSSSPDGGRGNGLYTWELVFWGYTLAVHCALILAATSPVDLFDTVTIIAFSLLCIMYLCKPRMDHQHGSDHAAGPSGTGSSSVFKSMVMMVLMLCTWLAFTSIPHVYEADRLWLLLCLVSLDVFLLIAHLYDSMPSMYTICMGRLTYTALMNLLVAYAFYSLKDRLQSLLVDGEHPVFH